MKQSLPSPCGVFAARSRDWPRLFTGDSFYASNHHNDDRVVPHQWICVCSSACREYRLGRFPAAGGAQRLNNRAVWSSLRTGERIKLFLKKTSEDGLVVHANGRTKEWNLGKGEAKVPRAMIQSVRFTGKVGRGGLIGGLAGLGAGGALIGAAATGESEGYVRAASLLAPILFGVAGYFVGSVFSPSAPAFVFE